MPSHRCPRPKRFGKCYASARKIICAYLFAAVIALFFCSPAHAQGGVPLVTVATDQSPLNLSNQFGVPTGTAINRRVILHLSATATAPSSSELRERHRLLGFFKLETRFQDSLKVRFFHSPRRLN
jgi:hypothetical protein